MAAPARVLDLFEPISDAQAFRPLDVAVNAGLRVTEVASASSLGDDLFTLLEPVGRVPLGGLVMAHGGSDDGRRFLLPEATLFAARGWAVCLPATSLPAHGDWPVTERAIRRSVLVQRRALDLLDNRVDASPRAFFGHSGGAFQGAILCAVDPRLDSAVLASFGTGTLTRVAAAELTHAGVDPAAQADYLERLEQFDPRHFLSRPHAAALLVQHGTADLTVPPQEAAAMVAAACPPISIRWYPCDHGTAADPVARADRLTYLSAAHRQDRDGPTPDRPSPGPSGSGRIPHTTRRQTR